MAVTFPVTIDGVTLSSDDEVAVTSGGVALMTAKPASQGTYGTVTKILLLDPTKAVLGKWAAVSKFAYDSTSKAWSVAL